MGLDAPPPLIEVPCWPGPPLPGLPGCSAPLHPMPAHFTQIACRSRDGWIDCCCLHPIAGLSSALPAHHSMQLQQPGPATLRTPGGPGHEADRAGGWWCLGQCLVLGGEGGYPCCHGFPGQPQHPGRTPSPCASRAARLHSGVASTGASGSWPTLRARAWLGRAGQGVKAWHVALWVYGTRG